MLSQFMVLFGFFALVLVSIFWINKAVRMFDRLIGDGQPAWVFLEFTALTLPAVIGVVLPIAGFAGAVYVTNRLSTESELTVMQATGYSPWRMMRPVVIYGLILAIMMSILTHFLIPGSLKSLRTRQAEVAQSISAKFLTEGEFLHPSKGIAFYIREITPEGELRNVFLSDQREWETPVIYSSVTAYLVPEGDGTKLVMLNGLSQSYDRETNRLFATHFDDFSYDISSLVSRSPQSQDRIEFASTKELLMHADIVAERTGTPVGKVLYEGHSRIQQALLCIVAAMIGFAALLLGTYSRFGVWWQIVTAFLLLVAVKLVEGAISGAALSGPSMTWLLYLPVLFGIGVTIALLYCAANPGLFRRLFQRSCPRGAA
nr:LPS export ABC transporter permease LptF [Roseovarius sp. EL26]